jgi:hypothetical protein
MDGNDAIRARGVADLRELAGLIRTLRPEEREALADDLSTISGQSYRCPAKDTGTGARCELDEGHEGPHEAVARIQWLVALRCRIGFDERGKGAECAKLHGHEGPCVPRQEGEPRRCCKLHAAYPNAHPSVPCSNEGGAHELDLRRSSKPGHVYFLQARGGGPIKIGHTKRDPSKRMRELEGPDELVLLALVPGSKGAEEDMHLLLAAHQRRGEWYEPHAEVMAEVEKARAAHPLPELEPREPPKKRRGRRGPFWRADAPG